MQAEQARQAQAGLLVAHPAFAPPPGPLPWDVKGDELAYQNSLNIPREKTPQFSGVINGRYNGPEETLPRFTAWLKDRGVTMKETRVPAESLKPIKASGSWTAVRGIADELKSGKRADTKQLVVSSDGYVIDGTQTWAAKRLADAEGGRPGLEAGVPVLQASVPASELLNQAHAFMEEIGMPTRKAGEVADPAYAAPAAPPADSLAKYTGPDGKIQPARAQLHEEIIARALAGYQPQEHPVATFYGGGPASGKSETLKPVKPGVVSDADAIKAQLPEYQEMVKAGDMTASTYTHEESSLISYQISARAMARKLNLVLDGTGDKSIENLAGKVQDVRKAGYEVHGRYVTADTETAVARAMERAKKTGRMVPPSVIRDIHQGVSKVFPQALSQKLFDSVELYENNGPKGSVPVKVIGCQAGELKVLNQPAYDRFLSKAGAAPPYTGSTEAQARARELGPAGGYAVKRPPGMGATEVQARKTEVGTVK